MKSPESGIFFCMNMFRPLCLFVVFFFVGKLCAQNPFQDQQAVARADSLSKQVIPTLSFDEKLREIAGPKGFYLRAAASMLAGKGMCVTPIGGNRKKGIPSVRFTDGPRGIIHGRQTSFPVPIARAATWNMDLERQIGEALGTEAKGVGASLLGTPCMNILRHPANGRAQESFGEDPFLTGRMALALARGIQGKGVMACAKHFALNSIEDTRYYVNVKVDKRSLHEVYLPHFRYLVENGVATLMSAYNKVNGVYCGENAYLLDTVLRQQWGFRGFVHSDWDLGTRSTAEAIRSGMNVEMMVPKFYSKKAVLKAIDQDKMTESDIDKLIYPTLFTKFLFAEKFPSMNKKETVSKETRETHRALSQKAAEEGMVLLQNKGNVLPIASGTGKQKPKILLTGYLMNKKNDGDHGSSYARAPYTITPKKAFKEEAGQLGFQVSAVSPERKRKLQKTLTKADYAVVIAGYYHQEEGEYISRSGKRKKSTEKSSAVFMGYGGGGDRHPLTLKKRDEDLINRVAGNHPKTIVQVISGSAVIMESWKPKVPAIIWSGYYGMEGARALPKLLFGQINPGGKLPFSIPQTENELPHFPIHADTVTYGYYHGYTLLDKLGREPSFAFGFGLGYGKPQISDIRTDKTTYGPEDTVLIICTVDNPDSFSCTEVVQVYVGKPGSLMERHDKVLRGFKKVWLSSGASAEVKIPVSVKEISVYDAISEQWILEKGSYLFWVGTSSNRNDLQDITVVVE